MPATVPREYQEAMDTRYRESERRMRELAGKQQAVQNRALRSQAGQRGFVGARSAGAEMSVLGSIGAQTSAEVIQKARELESQRLGEMNKWMVSERGHEMELGKMEAGYGYQSRLAKDKDDRAAQLMREGWDRSDANAQAERELKQTMQQAGFGQEQTMQDMIADLEREGWSAEEARNEAQRLWESGESELGRSHEFNMQDRIDALTREGWSEEAARQQAEIESREGMQQAGFTQESYMQEQIAKLTREGWTMEEARQQAALGWEREKMYGPGSGAPMGMLGGAPGGGEGSGGYGGTYGLAQQQMQLERDKLAMQESLTERGWSQEAAAREADRMFQRDMQAAGFTHDTDMAETNAELTQQVEQFKANQGQIAGAMAEFADAMNMRLQGLTDIGRHNQTIDGLNERLAQLYGYESAQAWIDDPNSEYAPLSHWEAAKYDSEGNPVEGSGDEYQRPSNPSGADPWTHGGGR